MRKFLFQWTTVLLSVVISVIPVDAKDVGVIETTMGVIEFEFLDDKAPRHVKNFKTLAKAGFYNGTTFHRVIPGFMIQGGDPNTKDNDQGQDDGLLS